MMNRKPKYQDMSTFNTCVSYVPVIVGDATDLRRLQLHQLVHVQFSFTSTRSLIFSFNGTVSACESLMVPEGSGLYQYTSMHVWSSPFSTKPARSWVLFHSVHKKISVRIDVFALIWGVSAISKPECGIPQGTCLGSLWHPVLDNDLRVLVCGWLNILFGTTC